MAQDEMFPQSEATEPGRPTPFSPSPAEGKNSDVFAAQTWWKTGRAGLVLGGLVVVLLAVAPFLARRIPPSPPTPLKAGRRESAPAPTFAHEQSKAVANLKGIDELLVAPVEDTNSIGMKLVRVPAGEFLMGISDEQMQAYRAGSKTDGEMYADEQPQHRVRITRPFFLGKYEVTQAEFRAVTGRNPSHFATTGEGKEAVAGLATDRFPVEMVTWFDAVSFCNALSEQESLPLYYVITDVKRHSESEAIVSAAVKVIGGNGYCLPTEAEWEYACRAGTTTPFYFGATLNGEEANVHGEYPFGTTLTGPALGRPTQVDDPRYPNNAFKLAQMHGNVWEWCQDGYDEKVYGKRGASTDDPAVGGTVVGGVARGGSFNNRAAETVATFRGWGKLNFRHKVFGFRVARNPRI